MHLSQYKLCTRKMELAFEVKFISTFTEFTRPWWRMLTNGSDVKYVFRGVSIRGLRSTEAWHEMYVRRSRRGLTRHRINRSRVTTLYIQMRLFKCRMSCWREQRQRRSWEHIHWLSINQSLDQSINVKSTRLALCQYTWPQYVHRSENHLNQNRSRKIRHDLPHPAWTFVCDTSGSNLRQQRHWDNESTHVNILLSSAMTMGSTSCKPSQDFSKRSREQIQSITNSTPEKKTSAF